MKLKAFNLPSSTTSEVSRSMGPGKAADYTNLKENEDQQGDDVGLFMKTDDKYENLAENDNQQQVQEC